MQARPGELFDDSAHPEEADVILAIRPTQRDPNRATVRVGSPKLTAKGTPRKGRVVVTLNRSAIETLGLRVGDVWDQRLAETLTTAGQEDQAFRAAARRLARRAMSAGMVRQKLRELGHELAAIESAMRRLDRLALLDDAAFGRALIREITRGKPAGDRLLFQKLRSKDLEPALIDQLLAEHRQQREEAAEQTGEDPDADAVAFAIRRAASLQRLEPDVRRRRLYAQLARRGFGVDTIRKAMEAALRDD
jgi:regulatory protein